MSEDYKLPDGTPLEGDVLQGAINSLANIAMLVAAYTKELIALGLDGDIALSLAVSAQDTLLRIAFGA